MPTPIELAHIARKNAPRKKPVNQNIRTKNEGTVEVVLSRSKAIKAFCTECGGWGEMHPKDCPDKLCPLYSFRGKIQLAYSSDEEPEDNSEDDED